MKWERDANDAAFCEDCGRSLSRLRYGPGAFLCRDCEAGLVPERGPRDQAPSAEYLARQKALWLHEGACVNCGTPPNGDPLSDGRCRACVLAMETEQEQIRQEQERLEQEAIRKAG